MSMDEEMEDATRVKGWECLPFELHRKILQILTYEELESKLVAEYAVVCKSWQIQVEEINFSNLTVKHDDLHEFEETVKGSRRAYLKHLWLKVELDKYSKQLRFIHEDDKDQEINNMKFTTALFDIFRVLEQWDTPEFWRARNGRGLNLELSAYSPSDRKHLFGERGLDPDGNSRYFDSLLDFYLLGIEDPQGFHGLPPVNVVTGLCILRRNYRNISASALTPILLSLPRVQEVRLEQWQQVDDPAQEDVDSELAAQLPFWPASRLKRVSIFEHFGAFEKTGSARGFGYEFLARQLRHFSTGLEELSASYVVDARIFFEPFIQTTAQPQPQTTRTRLPQWPNLRWLTLTSHLISADSQPEDISAMLCGAGKAAKNMPQLQAMEIYNANTRDAGVFRYLVVKNTPIISWSSTFDFKLDKAVKAVWRQVALQGTRQEPMIFDEVKTWNYTITGPEGFLHSDLATREMVLHPVSSTIMMNERPFPEPVLRLMSSAPAVPQPAQSSAPSTQ